MTGVSALDDTTTTAIREALSAAAAGKLRDAYTIGERALKEGGDPAALHAMLGTLKCRTGDLEAGIKHLVTAHAQRPGDAVIAGNLATGLAQLGRYSEALGVISSELAQTDRSLQLLRLRGFLAQNAGEFEEAIDAYERVVAAQPSDWESWNNLGNARQGIRDFEGGLKALSRAIEINPLSAPARLNFAMTFERANRPDEAEREYRRMIAEFPTDVHSLRELFALLKSQFRDEDALEIIEEAVRRAPDNIELGLGLASHRLSRLKHGSAEEAYRRVLTIDPVNVLAWLGVATVLDQTNRTEELAALVKEAESAGVAPECLAFLRAFDHRRAHRYADGLEALSHVPDELETSRRLQLLGQLLEGAGQYDEAFAAFERMNARFLNDPSDATTRARLYREEVRQHRDMLTPKWISSWRNAGYDERPSPVFLVGFPRSGTTLLDTILMSHPNTEVLEEEPTVHHAAQALGGFDAIANASDEQIRKARDAYFEIARSITALDPGKVLIDKMPLYLNQVPIIRRLFPDAKFILALRHPCDVVLSCYVTNFKTNNAMSSFLQLDTAAELYDLSFGSFEKARELLAPPVHTVTYENIVADRDQELRPLFDFLGLEWDERVLDHQSTAKGRSHIKTASYAQVVEPIYTRSAGRWQHYRKHLEAVMPILEPWVTRFGYTV